MQISQITENLFISNTPRQSDYQFLKSQGITNIVNMRADYFWFNNNNKYGIVITWVPTVDLFICSISPKKLLKTANSMSKKIQSNEKVLCFCRMGRHRSVAMAAAILIIQGNSADEAMATIKQKRPIADPYARHVKRTIYKFEKLWQKEKQFV